MKRTPARKRRLPSCRRGERGSALLVMLWAVMLLAFAVAMSGERVALMLGDSSLRARRVQARLLAESALADRARVFKEERRRLLEATAPGEHPTRPLDLSRMIGCWRSRPIAFEEGWFWLEAFDEQARIHWCKTPAAVWRNLLDLCGAPAEQFEAWLDAVADWEDPDDARALNGAESPDYLSLEEGRRRAKNAPITDAGELPWILGAPGILDLRAPADVSGRRVRLAEVTTLRGDGKINLNTAPAVLVAAVLGLGIEEARALVRARAGPDGVEGTPDDVSMERIPRPVETARELGTGSTSAVRRPVAGAATTTARVFRLRGVGWFQGQQVACEALVRHAGGDVFGLLEEPRPVEARSVGEPPLPVGR